MGQNDLPITRNRTRDRNSEVLGFWSRAVLKIFGKCPSTLPRSLPRSTRPEGHLPLTVALAVNWLKLLSPLSSLSHIRRWNRNCRLTWPQYFTFWRFLSVLAVRKMFDITNFFFWWWDHICSPELKERIQLLSVLFPFPRSRTICIFYVFMSALCHTPYHLLSKSYWRIHSLRIRQNCMYLSAL